MGRGKLGVEPNPDVKSTSKSNLWTAYYFKLFFYLFTFMLGECKVLCLYTIIPNLSPSLSLSLTYLDRLQHSSRTVGLSGTPSYTITNLLYPNWSSCEDCSRGTKFNSKTRPPLKMTLTSLLKASHVPNPESQGTTPKDASVAVTLPLPATPLTSA